MASARVLPLPIEGRSTGDSGDDGAVVRTAEAPDSGARTSTEAILTSEVATARARSLEEDLRCCLRIAGFVFHQSSLDEFLRLVLEEAIVRLRADRGSIFLYERSENVLYGFAMTGLELSPRIRLEATKGIVGEVVRTGEVLNIADAYDDDRFYKDVDKLTGYRTKAILCAPIRSKGTHGTEGAGVTWGALELLNPSERSTFDANDEESLSHILAFAGLRLQEHAIVERLLRVQARMESELALAKGKAPEEEVLRTLVGNSAPMTSLRQLLVSVAPFDSNVLVQGESGTGKELVAHCLHALSPRREKPLVALNCAAIPETLMEAELFGIESGVATGVTRRAGKIEQAHGGTLFLDEIGEMSLPTQAKLLRALQEKEITRLGGKDSIRVDVRFVSATHRDLRAMITEKTFREDLFYRLHVVRVGLPPLRERKGDIALLASHFLSSLNDKYSDAVPKTFAPGVLERLEGLPWRGNVRELHNEVERAYVISGVGTRFIGPAAFGLAAGSEGEEGSLGGIGISGSTGGSSDAAGGNIGPATGIASEGASPGGDPEGVVRIDTRGKPLLESLATLERTLVHASLARHQGNKTKTSEELGISREGLRKMLARWEDER